MHRFGSQWSSAIHLVVCTPFPRTVPLCHMYTCIWDSIWMDWAGGTWWASSAFSQPHPAALAKVPHCLVPVQTGGRRTATTFCDLLVLLAWWSTCSLSAVVTIVLPLASPWRLCLHLPCPRHSCRRVFYNLWHPFSPYKSGQSTALSTHLQPCFELSGLKSCSFSVLAELHPKLCSTTAVGI